MRPSSMLPWIVAVACTSPSPQGWRPLRVDGGGPGDRDTALDSGEDGGDDGGDSGTDDTAEPPLRPPNLLLLIADDFGLDLAAFDPASPCYEIGVEADQPLMPTLAALCAEGIAFERAWAQPSCSPTRASILVGQAPFQHRLGAPVHPDDEVDLFDLESLTLPRALALGGAPHAMASFGKWHLSRGPDDPNLAGWPTYAGAPIGTLETYSQYSYVANGVGSTVEDYATTRTVDDALSWLSEQGAGQPWLLWLGFNAPHDPFHLPPGHLHTRAELGEYADEADARPWVIAMSEALDTELGRLFEGLQDRDEWEDTVVIFLGDNGTDRNAVADPVLPYRTKGGLWTGSVQVPVVVGGGAVEGGGRRVADLIQVSDLHATLLELAGVDVAALRAEVAPEAPYDSLSFAPLLLDAAAVGSRTRQLAQVFPRGTTDPAYMGHGWSDGRYKAICTVGAGALYNLEEDPWEASDLMKADPVLPGSTTRMATFRLELLDLTGTPDLCPPDDGAP